MKLVADERLPVALPKNTVMLFEPWLATAKSAWLSPLKSALVTETGFVPAVKFVALAKLPVPAPINIDTSLDD